MSRSLRIGAKSVYCDRCNRFTDSDTCPECGRPTSSEPPRLVYWCDHCKTPIIHTPAGRRISCPSCGNEALYASADIRPVFPEERLLLEILKAEPLAYQDKAVWASGSRYLVDGKPLVIAVKDFAEADPVRVRSALEQFGPRNDATMFDASVAAFISANRSHEEEIVREAYAFIGEVAADYPEEDIVVSFSGGKDSAVTSDLVTRALSDPYIVHVFGDTTLEFPSTIEYAKRFREDHPLAIFKVARNNEQDFIEVAKEIGPPARMMRWCCSMFKTGPISRAFKSLYADRPILTFYGIRKGESIARSKYNRVEDNADAVKIRRQKVAAPIFEWTDADVWLYILSEKIDFNDAYRLGYERVGCWCCPNNNERAQFLSQIYMPDRMGSWRSFLIDFAKQIGKPDPEVYVDEGKWKARQGGNGLSAANSVLVDASHCATEDNAMIFSLERPFSDELAGLMTPIGDYAPGLGRSILDERVFVDHRTREPLISVLPFEQAGYDYAVKVRILKTDASEALLRMVRYQIVKYNACRQCLKCESLCRFGAIKISDDGYHIDPDKCMHCHQCVTDKYLTGGCMMSKYLLTKARA